MSQSTEGLTGAAADLAGWSEETVRGLLGGVGLGEVAYAALFVASFLGLALAGWLLFYGPEERGSGRGHVGRFLAFLFPRSIYLHRSSRADLVMVAVNLVASPLSMAAGVALGGLLASGTSAGLTALTGWDPQFQAGLLSIAGLTLCLALAGDLGTYLTHRMHHQVPWLWEFHKVHHSAEVLSPLTVLRKHPVFDLVARLMKACLVGPLLGLVFFLFHGPVEPLTAMGTNAVLALFHVCGAGLRHSHVWLSYGPVVERVFISPAQHQIHHSRARQHWDRNFGQVFAVWDWAFGTLYVPRAREKLEFGLDDTPAAAHAGVVGGFIRPFVNSGRILRRRIARRFGGGRQPDRRRA